MVRCDVDGQSFRSRHCDAKQRATAPRCQGETERAGNHGQHERFREQLTYDAPASGAKREPGRDLPVPRAGSRKQQRRDVQAGQQQNDDKHHQQESQPTFVRLAKTAVGAGRAWFES